MENDLNRVETRGDKTVEKPRDVSSMSRSEDFLVTNTVTNVWKKHVCTFKRERKAQF